MLILFLVGNSAKATYFSYLMGGFTLIGENY